MSTKYTLSELIDYGIVRDGDALVFSFKTAEFASVLSRGGIIHLCTWNGRPVFLDRPGFTSLTDWTDSCIQECANEFVTRFSSWRRVRHKATGNPLCSLRDTLANVKRGDPLTRDTPPSHGELLAERRKVIYLTQQLALARGEIATGQPRDRGGADNPFRL